MKKAGILLSFLLLLATVSFAQDSLHVKWTAQIVRLEPGEYSLEVKGLIKPGWHIYTKGSPADFKGLTISFADSTLQIETIPVITGKLKTITDPVFQKQLEIAEDSVKLEATADLFGTDPPSTKLVINYFVSNDAEFDPEVVKIPVGSAPTNISSNTIIIPSIDLDHPINNCGGTDTSGSLWQIFFFGILGGLASLFTPCFFPMLPLTVSFFTNKSGDRKKGIRNASLYGFFIFFIYVVLSLPFYFITNGGSELLNNISTNPWLNVGFFVVFVFFAISFFGYYDITLPDKFTNSANSKAGIGTLSGIFFMALTLAIVSFSCTGPLLGTLVVTSVKPGIGGAVQLTVAMAGFGLSLGVPFALFAMFPNLLKKLPKSGGWLNSFKVVLGFLELAFALKFLSNADQAEHWGILKREVFIGIWVIIGILITLYLFRLIKFPHDAPSEKLPGSRIFLGILFAAFALYLVPGLTNTKWASLSLISGFPPPLSYSIYHNQTELRDLDEAMKLAKAEHKPILLDFTGYACTNCRRMEELVWSKPGVSVLMLNKFIVVSLYVDDKKRLPAAEQFTYTTRSGAAKDINTVGDKWATLEEENFQTNSQPLYALINANGVLLNHPVGYTPDANQYESWLQCGLDAFGKKK